MKGSKFTSPSPSPNLTHLLSPFPSLPFPILFFSLSSPSFFFSLPVAKICDFGFARPIGAEFSLKEIDDVCTCCCCCSCCCSSFCSCCYSCCFILIGTMLFCFPHIPLFFFLSFRRIVHGQPFLPILLLDI